jgi:hypothetical protein
LRRATAYQRVAHVFFVVRLVADGRRVIPI